MSLIVESQSLEHLNSALASDVHALLISGVAGVGLRTIAAQLTSPTIIVEPKLKTSTSTVPQIGVEQIRELYESTRGKSSARTTVLIDDIDKMSVPAQNSFLKLLEEPGSSIRFIVTSHHPERLLPTIRSRLQHIVIASDNSSTAVLLKTISDSQMQKQLDFLAKGLPAELSRLMHDEAYFRSAIAEATIAKKLVEGSVYERLVVLSKEKLDRPSALRVLERTINFLQLSRPTRQSVLRQERMLAAYGAIEQNGNVKLQLTFAMV